MSEEDKKKFSPYLLERSLTSYLGSKPKCIRARGKNTYTIEIETKEESSKMALLREINGCEVRTTASTDQQRRALIYVKEYNMIDFAGYKRGLMEQFGFGDVMEATWIKVKDDRTKPLLIHLSGSEMPSYIDLPGEQEKTRVYEYRERPKVCQKCLEYGHRTKFCEKKNEM